MNDITAHADDLKSQARDALLKAGDQLSEQAYQMRDFAADVRYQADDFVQTNPWQAVAIAAGIGFVLGFIVDGAEGSRGPPGTGIFLPLFSERPIYCPGARRAPATG